MGKRLCFSLTVLCFPIVAHATTWHCGDEGKLLLEIFDNATAQATGHMRGPLLDDADDSGVALSCFHQDLETAVLWGCDAKEGFSFTWRAYVVRGFDPHPPLYARVLVERAGDGGLEMFADNLVCELIDS